MSIDEPLSADHLETCIKVLSSFNSNVKYPLLETEQFDTLRHLIHDLFHLRKKLKKKNRQDERAKIKSIDKNTKNSCLLRAGRAEKLQQLQLQQILVPDGTVEIKPTHPSIEHKSSFSFQRLQERRPCYICKLNYRTLHFFYDSLCPSCAQFNFEKRVQTTDLSNHVALVTGARVKIGYRILLKLLHANCFVIATTRFPMDLLNRLSKEHNFDQWKTRIHVYGIDFRFPYLIEIFTQMIINKYDRLDFLINNACQTIQRPKEFYQHLIANERLNNYSNLSIEHQEILDGNRQFYQQLCPEQAIAYSSQSSSTTTNEICPKIYFDVNQQPIDFRSTNSWMLRLNDLSANEINEVLTINTLAPFILNSKLKVLMSDKHPEPNGIKFIINVSAMEGSFSRRNKTDKHPHTNAAKAALNMMTRTSASDYQKSNIYMVSVDTGWINDEKPLERAYKSMIHRDFQTPLDEEDAAARVLDPIISTYQQLSQGKTNINIPYGCFLKDYRQCDW